MGDDGSSAFDAWHDTVLDVRCVFGTAADGSWRCIPFPIQQFAFSGKYVFRDPACTMPAMLTSDVCIDMTIYYGVRTPYDCALHVFKPLGQVFDNSLYAEKGVDGSCTLGPISNENLFALEEVLPADMAAGSIVEN